MITKHGYPNVLTTDSDISGPGVQDLKPNPCISEPCELFWNLSLEEFNQTYAVNTSAVFFALVAFRKRLEAGSKKIYI
jgi:hypothetical protein